MDEYANNLHARIDNILSDVQGSNQVNNVNNQPGRQLNIDYQNDFSIEIGVCWLIVGVLIGCIICFYSFYFGGGGGGDNSDDNGVYDNIDETDRNGHKGNNRKVTNT